MTHGTNTLRLVLLGAIATLAVAAPTASAQQVCNQATPHSLGGELVATDGDPTPPARYQQNLKAHPGQGAGLVNAASHSPALSLCGVAEDSEPGPNDPDAPSVDS